MEKGANAVIEILSRSTIYQTYCSAFCTATGVSLHLKRGDQIADGLDLSHPGFEFSSRGTYRGIAPVRDGARLVACICTAEMSCWPKNAPAAGSVQRFTPFLTMLGLFADQLGMLCSRILVQRATCEPSTIVKAKQYLQQHFNEHMELQEVARHACVSTFYLCKLFKKTTGLNFSTYLTHLRVEAAKQMLDRKTLRVSEIALEVGFQSLSHFNRVFKRIVGESPREYRRRPPLEAKSPEKPFQRDHLKPGTTI